MVVSKRSGQPIKATTLLLRFLAVEAIYELSQYADEPMPNEPWPGASAEFWPAYAAMQGSPGWLRDGHPSFRMTCSRGYSKQHGERCWVPTNCLAFATGWTGLMLNAWDNMQRPFQTPSGGI